MNEKVVLLKQSAVALMVEANVMRQAMDEMSEWNSMDEIVTNIKTLYKYLTKVVRFVQEAADQLKLEFGYMSSEDKLEAATAVVDDILVLPFYLEIIDGPFIKVVLSLIVTFLNDKFGHVWDYTQLDRDLQ